MEFIVRESANKDARRLPKDIKTAIKDVVIANIIEAKRLSDLKNCKQMKGHKSAYRIKYKEYRMGFFFEEETIIISRILHRKEVYRFFP
ncbi:MAG: type II toxin-antitoxin system RelE/ParE family toxin [Bacteroidetes bacterium]|nr:type II toxin-antitoxin system RelE/ParE family toxin [Bacteroidota bacterium]